ncbi:MAG TPA: CDGSH iron-sulfur domain-containing protein [Candidatus Paceibacterota bacterium]|nr:CDGSH iron-sulfur domain-containing protein [Candidatus Paceibacterota bacterium]
MENKRGKIKITKNGPYLISGALALSKEIIISDKNGDSIGYENGQKYDCPAEYALCRCGASKNKPFCDGSHERFVFDGTETASKEDYSRQCEKINGPELELDDLPELCALARFCHDQRSDVWNNTEGSDDPKAKNEAIRQACLCPSGRLVARDKNSGDPIEPKLNQEIGLIEDPEKGVSGPIRLKGGVELEGVNGEKYETRNRMTLCRCGKSRNKPYCDGTHIGSRFNDSG